MPYWDHKGETQGIASHLCDSYNKGKMPGLSLRWTGLFSFMWKPHHKCLQGYFHGASQVFACKGVFMAHLMCLSQRCIQGASHVFACKSVFGAHLRCLSAKVYSGRIPGVCLQRCIRCASQVFAIDGNGHRPCKRLGHSQPFLTWCDNPS